MNKKFTEEEMRDYVLEKDVYRIVTHSKLEPITVRINPDASTEIIAHLAGVQDRYALSAPELMVTCLDVCAAILHTHPELQFAQNKSEIVASVIAQQLETYRMIDEMGFGPNVTGVLDA